MSNPHFSWNGELKPTKDPSGRLCMFDTVLNGIRAGAINLLSYYLQDGCETVSEIVTRYAPPIENDTAAYIQFMAEYVGVDPNEQIVLTASDFLNKWVAGQIHYEQGCDACSTADISAGVQSALNYKK